MSVIRRAAIAGATLFALGCVFVKYVETNAEKIITVVALRALDDPEVIEIVYEYTSTIVERTLSDQDLLLRFGLFVNKILVYPEVEVATQKLVRKSVLEPRVIFMFANEILNKVKGREAKFDKDSSRSTMLRESFLWEAEKLEKIPRKLENLVEVLKWTKGYLPKIGFHMPKFYETDFYMVNSWKIIGAKVDRHSRIYNEFGGFLKGVKKEFLRVVRSDFYNEF